MNRFYLLLILTYLIVEYFVFSHYKSRRKRREIIAMPQHVDRKKLGAKIKRARSKLDMNVRQFADMLDVSRSTVTNYELGSTLPDVEFLAKLAALEETTIDSLIGND